MNDSPADNAPKSTWPDAAQETLVISLPIAIGTIVAAPVTYAQKDKFLLSECGTGTEAQTKCAAQAIETPLGVFIVAAALLIPVAIAIERAVCKKRGVKSVVAPEVR